MNNKRRISYLEYWISDPKRGMMSEPIETKNRKLITRIEASLGESELQKSDFFAENPNAKRYYLTMHYDNGETSVVNVVNDFVVINGECYLSRTRQLEILLKGLNVREFEKIVHLTEPDVRNTYR